GDDDAGDERREELGDLGEDGGDQQADHRCAYHCTEHYRQPAFAIAGTHYRHDGGDACEGHALYQWQLAAEEGDADGLQQGGGATDEQRGGNQQAYIGRRQARGLANYQWHGDDAAIHGQHVLQTVEQVGAKAEVLVLGALSGGGHGKTSRCCSCTVNLDIL